MNATKIIGLALCLVSMYLLLRQWTTIKGHEITTATVTDLLPMRGNKGTTWKVQAKYRDFSGRTLQYESAWASNPPAHRVGDTFNLMYDRDNPGNCWSLSFGTRFGAYWVMLGVGLFMLWIVMGWTAGDSIIQSAFPPTHP